MKYLIRTTIVSIVLLFAGVASADPAQALFQPHRSPAQLNEAIEQARSQGVGEGQILVAEMLFAVRSRDAEYIQANLSRWEEQSSQHGDEADEIGFLLHVVKALDALSRSDYSVAETQLKEAYWELPQGSQLIDGLVSEVKQRQHYATLTLDLNHKLPVSTGGETTLREAIGDNKAGVLAFWATWCGPCMQTMPGMEEKAKQYEEKGVRLIGINTESSREKANGVREQFGITTPWLTEDPDRFLSRELQVRTLPTYIMVSPEGKVLFFGHPSDPRWEEAIAELQ